VVSIGMPFSRCRHLAVTSKLSSARPIGSMNRWHELQVALVRWISIRSRVVSSRPSFAAAAASRSGTSGGGGGGGVPSSTSITHLPRSTGEVRLASDVCTSIEPWPRMPRRESSGYVTRRNSGPTTPLMP
jgi:hypothetical protein